MKPSQEIIDMIAFFNRSRNSILYHILTVSINDMVKVTSNLLPSSFSFTNKGE